MPETQKLLRITGGGGGAGGAEAVGGNACEIRTRAHARNQRRARRVVGLPSPLTHMRYTMKSSSDSPPWPPQPPPPSSTACVRKTSNYFKHVARVLLHASITSKERKETSDTARGIGLSEVFSVGQRSKAT